MHARLLLDTHILIKWLSDPNKLSREQRRVMQAAASGREPMAVAAMSLLEIGILVTDGDLKVRGSLAEVLISIEENPDFQILPLTAAVVIEAAAMVLLKDPADRVIAATARVHGLRLVTSDDRIIRLNVVSTID